MKDRAVRFSSLALLITVALFAWLTRARWGTVGIYPGLGWLVLGAAVFALALAGLFPLSRRRTAPAAQPPAAPPPVPPAPEATPVEPSPEEPEKDKEAVEIQ